MGRVFEKRKYKMFARYDKMAKAFTRIGKEIAIAVKQSGPDPGGNPRLRAAIQNAKSVNMPKDRVDAAIKRASSKDEKDYEEVIYEGYGPNGVAILLECATDNPTRTVANVRMYFNRGGGALGKTGSLDFVFSRKGLFKFDPTGLDLDEMELELIDYGLEDIAVDEENIGYIYTGFQDYGGMQKILEEKGIKLISSELTRVPLSHVEPPSEEAENEILEMVAKMEEDDDVQNVYHNIK
jgi:YebC/PmpR family DNA-binding regulatory protein